jgi:hypothetical protein
LLETSSHSTEATSEEIVIIEATHHTEASHVSTHHSKTASLFLLSLRLLLLCSLLTEATESTHSMASKEIIIIFEECCKRIFSSESFLEYVFSISEAKTSGESIATSTEA